MSHNNEQTEILKEILKWIKVTSFSQVKEILTSVLDNNAKKLIYQLSDGKNGQDDIIKKANASSKTISKYWQEWEKMGLGEPIPVRKGSRFKKLFDLSDFGIDFSNKERDL